MNATAKPPLWTPLAGPLPFPESASIEGYVLSRPKGRQMGGDFHAAEGIDERTFCMLLGDGRGKGTIGTLQMLPLLTAFRLVFRESTAPSYIMHRLAEASRTCKVEATAICFVIRRIEDKLWLSVSSAGHPPLILVSRSHQGRFEFPRPDSPAQGRTLHPDLDCQMAEDR